MGEIEAGTAKSQASFSRLFSMPIPILLQVKKINKTGFKRGKSRG
jgi:hypothetical protein